MPTSLVHRFGGHVYRRRGFTLLEVLIVLGILVLLATILLTVLPKAWESSRRTTCLNNLHNIAAAIIAYTVDNRGTLPGGALGAPKPPPPPAVPTDDGGRDDDWIYWQSFRMDKVGQGGIGPYLKLSNDPKGLAVMRCPKDDFSRSKLSWAGGKYPFSYVINGAMASDHSDWGGAGFNARTLAEVLDAPTKILVYEEDSRVMEDGNGVLFAGTPKSPGPADFLSIRHSIAKVADDDLTKRSSVPGVPPVPNVGALGNAAFCDGHAAMITRGEVHSRLHYAPNSGIPPFPANNSIP